MLRSVEDARAKAVVSYNRNLRGWVFGAPVNLSIPLGNPTKKQVNEAPGEVLAWREQWKDFQGPGLVEWTSKRLGNYGSTEIPTHLKLSSKEDVAWFVGAAKELTHILTVYEMLRPLGDQALRSTFGHWRHYSAEEAKLVFDVCTWIKGHDLSEYYVRELPIRGVHSKWVENHRLVLQAACGKLGFKSPENLCEFRYAGFLGALPLVQIELPETCGYVLVIENRTTFLALPDLPGMVLVNGGGFAASRLAEVPWLRGKTVFYWGDLDVHGFEILDGFRRGLPRARSVLMDMETICAFDDMAVADNEYKFAYTRLTEEEREAVYYLRERHLRIEQERILLEYAVDRIVRELRAS
ncbi:Wadjet anti-phage system protein JetD domain-containing protein [Corynebacterium vitaeruminis]|uniref:Wadjet anti-phage system protein JetD domain-containing protein n=1 Tax=Corynebacterium vitaeruminis TaxID=38305 RepID=UPI0023F47020|nr:Wadjet anti-phage system protein JetD domain-containing protein [Corynebacterium vitaeruminis]